jgi:two-component system, cell cycle sensor histidine kinase and response regulator CckA
VENHEVRQFEPASIARHETILIAEDDESLRELEHEFLCGGGYTLLDGKDGREALEIAAKHPGPIHLLVTDVVMPGLSGRELAECLTVTHPGIKTLFVSGYPNKEITDSGALEAGAAFLDKPFSKGDLIRKVRELLNAGVLTQSL